MRVSKLAYFLCITFGLILLPNRINDCQKAQAGLWTPPVWYSLVGIIHGHTGSQNGYDDGQWSVKQWAQYGRGKGLDFIILTPHANTVDKPTKEINGSVHYRGKTGYQNFVNDCISNSNGILMIPGAEFGDDKDHNSHALVLGLYNSNDFYTGLKIYNGQGQKATLDYFRSKNKAGHHYVTIAAHPDLDYIHLDKDRKIRTTNYHFNFAQASSSDICGLELLNNGNSSIDTLSKNLSHLLQFRQSPILSFTGGCDFHTDLAEKGDWLNGHLLAFNRPFPHSLFRRTVVWSQTKTAEDILDGINRGKCGAIYPRFGFKKSMLPKGWVGYNGTIGGIHDPNIDYSHYYTYFDVDVNNFKYTIYQLGNKGSGWYVRKLPTKIASKKFLLENITTEKVGIIYNILIIDSSKYFLVVSPQKFYDLVDN
jgi:hypothetical protein